MILDRLARAPLRADVSWRAWDDRWYTADPGSLTGGSTGLQISPDTAARVSAVFACVSLRADILSTMPCDLFRRLDNGGKEKAKDHPLYKTIRRRPNGSMSAADFFGFGEWHNSMVGHSLFEQRRRRTGIELLPIHPRHFKVEEVGGGRNRFVVSDPKGGRPRTLLQEEVLYVRDLTADGLVGVSRSALAREAIAVAAAGEAFVGGFFKHDAAGRIVISRKGNPPADAEARKRQREEFADNMLGWANRRQALHLWNDAQLTEVGRDLDGQFLTDPRKYQASDVARFWRIPGFMIGLEEKSTSWGTGIEQQKQGMVDFTMRPIATRWTQAMSLYLLDEDEQEEYFFDFNFDDLLRGDTLATVQAMAIERANGALSPNEWRIGRNRNPREGGDEFLETPTGAAPNALEPDRRPPPRRDEDDEDEQAGAVPAPLLADAAHRIAKAEAREMGKRAAHAASDPARYRAWLATFAADGQAYSRAVLAPLAEAYGIGSPVVEDAVQAIAATLLEGAPTELEGRTRGLAIVLDETFRAGAALRPAA